MYTVNFCKYPLNLSQHSEVSKLKKYFDQLCYEVCFEMLFLVQLLAPLIGVNYKRPPPPPPFISPPKAPYEVIYT